MEGQRRLILFHSFLLVSIVSVLFLGGLATIRYVELRDAGEPLAAERDVYDHDRSLRLAVDVMPPCAHKCFVDQLLFSNCAYPDYHCLCSSLRDAKSDELKKRMVESAEEFEIGACIEREPEKQTELEICLRYCPAEQQWNAPAHLQRMCDNLGVTAVLPKFMAETMRIYGRQFFSSGGFFSDDLSAGNGGGIIGGQSSFFDDSSTITDTPITSLTSSIRRTESSTLTTKTSTSSRGQSSPTESSTTDSSGGGGLSTGAKAGIGIGFGVLALIVLAVLLLLRRRKKQKAARQETSAALDSGAVPTIAEADGRESQLPPSYEKMEGTNKELVTTPAPVFLADQRSHSDGSRLSPQVRQSPDAAQHYDGLIPIASKTQYKDTSTPELSGHDREGRNELSADDIAVGTPEMSSTPALAHANIARKPISPAVSPPLSQSTAPPPWDHDYNAGYAPTVERDAESSEPTRTTGTGASDDGVRQMEEKMVRIKAEKERLHRLQRLEEEEEELRRNIEARKAAAAGS